MKKTNQLQKNISNEWQLIPAGDVFEFIKTYSFSRDNLTTEILSSDRVGCIHYGDIHSTYIGTTVDISKTKIPCINDKGFSPKKEELLKDGDLVMADASEDYEGIGVTVSIHGIGKNKVVGGLHTFVLRDNKNKTTEYYRQYIFRNKEIRNKLQKVANGVSVYGISKTALSKMFLPIPAIPEQNRIVSVLETWDKTIENLNKKIEIKKQIKKCLMQDLLTGKKRLEGFNDKWEVVMLGNICDVKTGKKDVNEGNPNGKYPFFTCAKEHTYSDNYSFDTEAILIAGNGEVGNCLYYKGKFEAYQRTYVLSNFKKESMYIYQYLNYFFQNIINSQKQMGAMPYIKLGMLQEFEIKIPKDLTEQKEIANVLIITDKEIIELERKLSIIKDQKKFLLNNLITGVIRTPENLLVKVK
ncbi:MAG: restriction endonuclease subunit S [Minisyncoccia bacterium]